MEFSGAGTLVLDTPPEDKKSSFRSRYRTMFRAYCGDGYSTISRLNMQKIAMKTACQRPGEDLKVTFDQTFDILDKTVLFGKTSINEEDFVAEWMKISFGSKEDRRGFGEKVQALLNVTFAALALSNDTQINMKQFLSWYSLNGLKSDKAGEVYESLDKDKDGVISLQEFSFGFISFCLSSDTTCSGWFGAPVPDESPAYAKTPCEMFEGAGFLPLDPPKPELKNFFRRKYRSIYRVFSAGGRQITKLDTQKLAMKTAMANPGGDLKVRFTNQCDMLQKLILSENKTSSESEFVQSWMDIAFGDQDKRRSSAQMIKETMRSSFDILDFNSDGSIDKCEFQKGLELVGGKQETSEDVFSVLDQDSDEQVTYSEYSLGFASFMLCSGPDDKFSLWFGQLVPEEFMEFEGVGRLSYDAPDENLKPFFQRKYKTMFRAYNKQGNPEVNIEQMAALAKRGAEDTPDPAKSEEQLKDFYGKWILFGKEKITEEEFVSEWIETSFGSKRRVAMEQQRTSCEVSYSVVDLDRNGQIDYEEFVRWFFMKGGDHSKTKTVFEAVDQDKDGTICFTEWSFAFLSFLFSSNPDDVFSLWFGQVDEK